MQTIDKLAARRRLTDATEGLLALQEGNRRFTQGNVLHAHQAADWRAHLTSGQQPFATIVSCSDSRVPPELVFDQGFGDLFVIRVAGNVIDADVIGSIDYAVQHLKTPLVVVMGHESCGAVTAALQAMDGQSDEDRYIAGLLHHIIPGLSSIDRSQDAEHRVCAAVEANVRHSLKILRKVPESRQPIEQKKICLEGAVYALNTGVVRFLED